MGGYTLLLESMLAVFWATVRQWLRYFVTLFKCPKKGLNGFRLISKDIIYGNFFMSFDITTGNKIVGLTACPASGAFFAFSHCIHS